MQSKIKEILPYSVLEHVTGKHYSYISKLYSTKDKRGTSPGTKSHDFKIVCDEILDKYFNGIDNLRQKLKADYTKLKLQGKVEVLERQ